MEVKIDKVTLASLGGGVVAELFEHGLKQVLDNMADRNTEVKKKRTITLTVDFVPTEVRDAAAVEIACKVKLAPVKPAVASLLLGQEGTKQTAVEQRMVQRELFDESDKVRKIGREAAAGTTEVAAEPPSHLMMGTWEWLQNEIAKARLALYLDQPQVAAEILDEMLLIYMEGPINVN